jgi:hypothetical protein
MLRASRVAADSPDALTHLRTHWGCPASDQPAENSTELQTAGLQTGTNTVWYLLVCVSVRPPSIWGCRWWGCVRLLRRGGCHVGGRPWGLRLFDRADLDAYLGRPVSADDPGGRERVEALYCRVSGSTGRESLLANRQGMLRESLSATVFRVYRDRGSRDCGSRRLRLNRLLNEAA